MPFRRCVDVIMSFGHLVLSLRLFGSSRSVASVTIQSLLNLFAGKAVAACPIWALRSSRITIRSCLRSS